MKQGKKIVAILLVLSLCLPFNLVTQAAKNPANGRVFCGLCAPAEGGGRSAVWLGCQPLGLNARDMGVPC